MISKWIYSLYSRIGSVLYIISFLLNENGWKYGVGILIKLRLIKLYYRNSHNPGSQSMFLEHIALANEVLSIPPNVEGDVAEFGCYQGMSTASLSLVCGIVNRRLKVFDSFEGLPEPLEKVTNMVDGKQLPYKRGDFSCSLDQVKRNIDELGILSVCDFIVGYYDQTLTDSHLRDKFILIFEDVDLPSSTMAVIRFAWPKLQSNCKFYTHEARDFDVVSIFFDRHWWSNELGISPPGLIGSGNGINLGLVGSYLGFAIKRQAT